MRPNPLLWIIAPWPDTFDLAHLPWCAAAKDRITVNSAKYQKLEMVEVIVDGMSFALSRLTAAEAGAFFAAAEEKSLLPDSLPPTHSAIGVALGENLANAGHLAEINQRLLLVGQWLGESLNARVVVWMPSRSAMDFARYRDAVARYLAGGATPFPVQMRDKEA